MIESWEYTFVTLSLARYKFVCLLTYLAADYIQWDVKGCEAYCEGQLDHRDSVSPNFVSFLFIKVAKI